MKLTVKNVCHLLAIAASLSVLSCNELRRANDSNLNEVRNKAAEESNTGKFSGEKQRDAEFVFEVIAATYGEIKLAELANQRSRTPQVKAIAHTMQSDHTISLNELKILAQARAISVPVEETDASKRKLQNIADESGEDFDKEWCEEMMDMHDISIDKFEKRLKDTDDPELKTFISKTLSVLKKHHESLKACY